MALNITDYVLLAETAIKIRLPSGKDQYHLCHWCDSIQCNPRDHTDIKHKIFMDLSRRDIELGLTNMQWAVLQKRLWEFYEGKYPCEINPKPSQ